MKPTLQPTLEPGLPVLPVPAIGYLVSRYPAVSHTFILREIQQLRELGHRIHTASINPADRALEDMDAAERAEAEATYCVKAHGAWGAIKALVRGLVQQPGGVIRLLWNAAQMQLGSKGLAYAAEALMLAQWMHSLGLTRLHVHFGNAGATVGLLVKALTGCHLSYTIHGPDEFDDVGGQRLALKMQHADAVVCISQFARGQLMRISRPADWDKFQVCRLGVDPTLFNYEPRTPRIAKPDAKPQVRLLCVGRLTPAKGQVVLVQACAALRELHLNFHLTLVGEGPDRKRIEAEIARHRLGGQVRLTGAVGQARVREALAQADIFVLPSFAEGIPVVLMEAMASGVPCVSTPVNGIPELIAHRQTGLLATAGDVDSLVKELATLIREPALRSHLAQAARAKVERDFDLQTNVQALGRIFANFDQSVQPVSAGEERPWTYRF
jgi:glycosyltransferase involved in cell wall biosynthesis